MKFLKNKIIEKVIRLFLQEIDKVRFARSFKKAAQDEDLLSIAEEGMADYYTQLEDWDETI